MRNRSRLSISLICSGDGVLQQTIDNGSYKMHDGKNDTIYELLKARAEHAPEALAILAPGRSALTYGGLLSQVDRVMRLLNVRGVRHPDRVAIVLPNGPEMAVAFLATAIAGISAPLNPAYRESEFDFYLSDLNAKALIVQEGIDSPAMAVACRRGIPILALSPDRDLPDEFTIIRSVATSSP